MADFTNQTKFKIVSCGKCHVEFAMTTDMHNRRTDDHETFWCPNGHRRCYAGKSNEEKLKAEVTSSKNIVERLEYQLRMSNRKITTYKGHLTRAKKKGLSNE